MRAKTLIFGILALILLVTGVNAVYNNDLSAEDFIFVDYHDEGSKLTGELISLKQYQKENPNLFQESYSAEDDYEYSSQNCKTLQYTGDSSNKLDIVFVPTNSYIGQEYKFYQDVELFKQSLYEYSEFEENKDKINIHMITKPNPNDQCYLQSNLRVSCSVYTMAYQMAPQCEGFDLDNNDQVVVINNRDVVHSNSAYAMPTFNYVVLDSYYPYALVHELGHSFVKLGDEYPISNDPPESSGNPQWANCANNDYPGFTYLDKWGELIGINGVDHFPVCGYSNWEKPTVTDHPMVGDCVMSQTTTKYFDPVGKRELEDRFSIYTPEKDYCVQMQDIFKSSFNSEKGDINYTFKVDLNKDGKIDLNDFSLFGKHFNDENWCSAKLNQHQKPIKDFERNKF